MLKWVWILFLSWPMNIWSSEDHALYLSVIEMSIAQNQLVDMKVKVFSDDLVDVVRAEVGAVIPMSDDYSSDHLDAIEQYFGNHLFLIQQRDTITFSIDDAVIEGDATWIDLSTEQSILGDFDLMADFFMEIFPTQANMVRLSVDAEKRFYQLRKSEPFLSFGSSD